MIAISKKLVPGFLALLCASCYDAASNQPVPPPVLAPGSGLTVEVRKGTGIMAIRGHNSVKIRFRNAGPDTVTIVKALDGSSACRLMPWYRFMVDRKGQRLKPMPGCGNFGLWESSKWPKDYLVELKPGDAYESEELLPCEVEQAGPHTISFEYTYQPAKEEHFAPPPSAWRGTVKAASVVLDLQKY